MLQRFLDITAMIIEHKFIRAIGQELLPTLVEHFILGSRPGRDGEDKALEERCSLRLTEGPQLEGLRKKLEERLTVLENLDDEIPLLGQLSAH